MALYEEESPWEKKAREQAAQRQRDMLTEQYGAELGNALAESSLKIGLPVDENLAKTILEALNSESPEQQLKAIMALLAYAKEAGAASARNQSRKDHAVY